VTEAAPAERSPDGEPPALAGAEQPPSQLIPRAVIASSAVQLACLLALAILILLRFTDDFPRQVTDIDRELFGVGTPGETLVTPFDWLRAASFFGIVAVEAALLAVSLVSALHASRTPWSRPGVLRRGCFRVAALVALMLGWLGLTALHAVSVLGPGGPPGIAGDHDVWAVLIVVNAIASIGVLVACVMSNRARPFRTDGDLRRTPLLDRWGRRWGIAIVVALGVVVAMLASEDPLVGTSNYVELGFEVPNLDPPPFLQGFRTIQAFQRPATVGLDGVSCSDDLCVAYGAGDADRPFTGYPEVAVSTNGGGSWRAWLLPVEPNQDSSLPIWWNTGMSCAATTCAGSLTNGSVVRIVLTSAGRTSVSIGPPTEESGAVSCPSPTWCVAVSVVQRQRRNLVSFPLSLLISTDGGRSWTARAVPESVWGGQLVPYAPAGLEPIVSCPVVGKCVLAVGLLPRVPLTLNQQTVGGIAITLDGGRSWTREALPTSTQPFVALDCPDAGHCWGVTRSDTGLGE
jgi:hypothetical protein